jgi:hypothetical protein
VATGVSPAWTKPQTAEPNVSMLFGGCQSPAVLGAADMIWQAVAVGYSYPVAAVALAEVANALMKDGLHFYSDEAKKAELEPAPKMRIPGRVTGWNFSPVDKV